MCPIELKKLKEDIEKGFTVLTAESIQFPYKVGAKMGIEIALKEIDKLVERLTNDSSN